MTEPTPDATNATPRPLLPPALAWIVGVLVGVHFLQWTALRPEVLVDTLGFQRGDLDAGRWWTVLSHATVHGSLLLLALNVYVLLLFGPRLERFWGSRRFTAFAALATLGGWFVHLFIGADAPLLGASSASLGVLGAHAMRWGGEERILPGGFTARVRWLAAVIGAIVLLMGLQEPVGGGVVFLAHVGGLATAWAFARSTRVLFVERFREGVSAMPDEPPDDQLPRAVPKTLPRSRSQRESIDDVVARTNAQSARRQAPARPRSAQPSGPPPSVDAILDKISAQGVEALTPEERRVLDDHSRRLRDS